MLDLARKVLAPSTLWNTTACGRRLRCWAADTLRPTLGHASARWARSSNEMNPTTWSCTPTMTSNEPKTLWHPNTKEIQTRSARE